ncbi:MAG: hypothetical protein ACD_63C00039G0005 [uncultured bacterium]|nr:MAG: hypothetical protein ACD_63C00039G0005 [uncultured bacterium]
MELDWWFFLIFMAFAGVFMAYVIYLHTQLRAFKRRFRQFFGTKKSPHLNAIVMRNVEDIKKLRSNVGELFDVSQHLHLVSLKSIQKVGVFHYNPYGDTGGNLSFSVALLDAEDNGVVTSSLHARSGTRVYSKGIEAGKSKQHLTEEEMEAIKRAT